jgi:hypothetical protein
LKKKQTTIENVLFKFDMESTHSMKLSMATIMYLIPLTEGGLQSMKSMAHFQKGFVVTTWCKRAGGDHALGE